MAELVDPSANRKPHRWPVALRKSLGKLMAFIWKRGGKASRTSIMVTTVLFTSWCGWVAFGEPLEDIFRGGRYYVTPRQADGKVVIVKLDDKTFDRIGLDFSERYDATVIENLKRAGAKRVFYDRIFADVYDKAGARDLIDALKKHRGTVYFGVIKTQDPSTRKIVTLEPNAIYRPLAKLASLNAQRTPFSLSMEMNYADNSSEGTIPSISSVIAGVRGAPGSVYRPDWRIRASTTPKVSYIDIVDGNFNPKLVRGKDVIVGPDSARIMDLKHIMGQDWVSGVYLHAIGAQTLNEGKPTRQSWIWPYLVALALAWVTLATNNKKTAVQFYSAALAASLCAPFVTDAMLITIDYVPAILLYGIVAYRSHSFKAINKAEQWNAETMLPNLKALREDEEFSGNPLVALIIKNYADIFAAFPNIAPIDLTEAVVRAIKLTDAGARIYQDDNILYWKPIKLEAEQLRDHIEGIGKLIGAVKIASFTVDLDIAVGIDTQVNEQIAKRINAARIAASRAASDGVLQRVYVVEASGDAQWRLSLMSELDKAIDAGDLSVAYQPQLDLVSGEINSAEALVRWNHPERGPISPTEFIEQAEATNRIDRLTTFVLNRTIEDLVELRKIAPDFTMAVNLSTKLLAKSDLVEHIASSLATAELPPSAIKLEITETAAMTGNEQVTKNLEILAAAGMSISIDDYGTGHATLEYLRTIPFKEIKIDREFIQNICSSKKDELLVRSTIGLAHALGHAVTAEGIEDEATLKMLKRLKCDRIQGYFVARPGTIASLEQLLLDQQATPHKTNLAFG